MIADIALLLAVPAYLTALATVMLPAVSRSALRGTRRFPRHGAGAQ